MKNFKILFVFLMCCIGVLAYGKDYTLKSPDGKLITTISVDKQITYSLRSGDQLLLDKSTIALILDDKVLGQNPQLTKTKLNSFSGKVDAYFYRSPSFITDYNEINLSFKGKYSVTFRAYNDGVAYRFNTSFKEPFILKNELAEFNFDQDYTTYMAYSTAAKNKDPYAMAFQNFYVKARNPIWKLIPECL